jgi:hypothetical protein
VTNDFKYGLLDPTIEIDQDGAPNIANTSIVNTITNVDVVQGAGQLSANELPITNSKGIVIKFSKIVDGENGFLYAIPYNDDRIIQINVETGEQTTIHTVTDSEEDPGEDKELFSTAILVNGSIFCIPYNYQFILRVQLFSPMNVTQHWRIWKFLWTH